MIGMFIPGNPAFNFLFGMLAARIVNGFAASRILRRIPKRGSNIFRFLPYGWRC